MTAVRRHPRSPMHVARITIWPVAGLDGVEVDAVRVLPSGALENDRRWRLVDADGRPLGGEVLRRLAPVRTTFALADRTITLSYDPRAGEGPVDAVPASVTVPLRPGPTGPCPWLSRVSGVGTFLEERADGGFSADAEAPGPTVAGGPSIAEVARWFGLPPGETSGLLRVGVEIDGCDAFWEDTLASPARPAPRTTSADGADPWAAAPPPEPRSIVIGDARFVAVGLRELDREEAGDPAVRVPIEHFRGIFEAWRRRSGRADVDSSHWAHRYRFGATTVGDGQGGEMRVGDRCVPVAHLGSR